MYHEYMHSVLSIMLITKVKIYMRAMSHKTLYMFYCLMIDMSHCLIKLHMHVPDRHITQATHGCIRFGASSFIKVGHFKLNALSAKNDLPAHFLTYKCISSNHTVVTVLFTTMFIPKVENIQYGSRHTLHILLPHD